MTKFEYALQLQKSDAPMPITRAHAHQLVRSSKVVKSHICFDRSGVLLLANGLRVRLQRARG